MPQSVWEGFIIMVFMIVFGVALSIAAGFAIDTTQDLFMDSGFLDDPGPWDQSYTVNIMVNLIYVIVYLVPIIGIWNFIVVILRYQRYDRIRAVRR